MPPSSQSRASGVLSNSTTIAIVLVLVIPTVLLLGLCIARRMPWFEPLRRRARAVAPRFRRQPGAAGPESLQKLPVIRYDEKLFNADPEGAKSDVTTTPDSKQRLRNLLVSFSRVDWSTRRVKGNASNTSDGPKKSMSHSIDTSSDSESEIRKLAMHACAICTEDFCKGTKVRKLPCGHIFHPRCIDPWLSSFAATCPLCRIDLSVKEATSRVSKPRRAVVVAPMSDTTAPPSTPPPTMPTAAPPTLPAATPDADDTSAEASGGFAAENTAQNAGPAAAPTADTTTTLPAVDATRAR